jgi:hypothetical protein
MAIVLDYDPSLDLSAGISVAGILARTDDILLDADRVRWPLDERLRWINEAAGAIIVRRPQARARTLVASLEGGSLQQLPDAGCQFLDMVRNVGPDGAIPGRAIRRTDRQLLDDTDPDWHAGTASSTVKHFTYDDRTPTCFYVYPPALAGTKVQIVISEMPPAVETGDDALDIQPQYLEPIVNYVCYRAKAKDSEYANAAEAGAFYAAFQDALGMNAQAKAEASPNQPGTSV